MKKNNAFDMKYDINDFAIIATSDSNDIEMLSGHPDPVEDIYGRIVIIDDALEIIEEVGSLKLLSAKLSGWEDLFPILDQSASLSEFDFLYDFEQDCLKEEIMDYFDTYSPDLIVIDRLYVNSKFTGMNIGLRAIHYLLNKYGREGIVVLRACPLQHEKNHQESASTLEKMGLDKYPKDFDVSLDKLVNHYAKLGFKLIPGEDDMMVLPMNRVFHNYKEHIKRHKIR